MEDDEIERRVIIQRKKDERIRARMDALASSMMRTLETGESDDMDDMLRNQAQMLDLTFRKLMARTCDPRASTDYCIMALKTQNQFRKTVLALKALKNKGADSSQK